MAQAPTVLVADSSDDRRRDFGLALYEGGYEVINAVNGEEALRFAAGLDPTLMIAHEELDGMAPLELYEKLEADGRQPPPMLVFCDGGRVPDDERSEGDLYFVPWEELVPARFLYQVRLLLLAREIGGELSDSIDVLYGDLTRISFRDLLDVLQRFTITGHVRFAVGSGAGFWLADGQVTDAHWGETGGAKAFNRIAGLHRGSFVVDLEAPPGERLIDASLTGLVQEALEERSELDELLDHLPPLNSLVELEMKEDFFDMEFSDVEQEVITCLQGANNLADLIDKVPAIDHEVIRAVIELKSRSLLAFREPEHKVHVVTDSTCDLLPAQTRRQGITVVPLSVIFDKKVFKDGIDLQPDRFYSMLWESKVMPSTSPPSKGEFVEAYRRLIATGDVVSVHMSMKQSLTGEHARQAAEEGFEEFVALRDESGGDQPKIVVVDSKSDSIGLGMLVVFASRLARKGLGAEEIGERLESIRSRTHLLFVVDTLEFLRRGGRIGGASALIGTLLGIKPILGVIDGEVGPIDKARGGRKASQRMIEHLKQRVNPGGPVFAGIAHASAPKWAGKLRELLEKDFSIAELMQSEIGPVVGAHAGPGTVGAVLFQPTAEELELLREE